MLNWFKKTSGRAPAKPVAPCTEALNASAYQSLCDGNWAEAGVAYRRLIELSPSNAKAHRNLGFVFLEQGRAREAQTSLAESIRLDADNADSHYMMGKASIKLGSSAAGVTHFQRSLQCDAEQPFAYRDLCVAFASQGDFIAARDLMDQGVKRCPEFAELHYLQGTVDAQLQQYELATSRFERAEKGGHHTVELYYNQGIALQNLHRFDEAIASYGKAIKLQPQLAQAHFNESACHLLQGNLEAGWKKFEWRWQTSAMQKAAPALPAPLWLGCESLEAKTILLVAEQGYGDTIQMCRYAAVLAQRGASVLLIVPEPLRALLAGVAGVERLLTNRDVLPRIDYYCPLLSLPLALETTLDTIPAPESYLHSDPHLLDRLRHLAGSPDKVHAGVVWCGNPAHTNDHNRSLPLETAYRLVNERIELFSLQKDLTDDDRHMLDQRGQISDLGQHIGNFADTAALIDMLDLVITVDTAVAHLAGAMGKTVWLMLPRNPDWRWMSTGDTSPWYPSMRLFRQPAVGDWDSVIGQVALALASFVPPER